MTTKRIAVMKQLLAFAGIEQDRLHLEWVSAAEGPKFAQVITEFTNRIKALGPSSLKVAA
jgi:F420-non-reducing hydrogenase iron-sulfur subunit